MALPDFSHEKKLNKSGQYRGYVWSFWNSEGGPPGSQVVGREVPAPHWLGGDKKKF